MIVKPRPDQLAGFGATSFYEERLVEDILLLGEVLAACACGDERRLVDLGVLSEAT